MIYELIPWIADPSRLDYSVGGVNPAKIPIYLANLPAEGGAEICVLVRETQGGSAQPYAHRSEERFLQFTARGRQYSDAREQIERVFETVHNAAGIRLSSWFVNTIQASGTPGAIGKDEQGREIFAWTCGVTVQEI